MHAATLTEKFQIGIKAFRKALHLKAGQQFVFSPRATAS